MPSSLGERKAHWLPFALLLIMAALYLTPFMWMLSTSLKHEASMFPLPGEPPRWLPTTEVMDEAGRRVYEVEGHQYSETGRDELGRIVLDVGGEEKAFWPDEIAPAQQLGFHWRNYVDAFEIIDFWQNLRNTLFVCFSVVLATIVSCSLVAYSFARIEWPGRNVAFVLVLATMMIPYQVTLIPLFVLYKEMGWTGSFKPLIVPALFGTPFYIFLLRQFFLGIPQELSAAARIDGCSEFGIYARIIMPLSKPALATTALFMFMYQWGDFLNPLIYLQDDRQYTLAVALQQFQNEHQSAWGPLMAMSCVITAPVVVLFFFTQRTFIQGITMTGLKG